MAVHDGPWPTGSLMARLSPADRAALLELGTRVQFAHEQVLVRQGEPGLELYVLLDGFVKVTFDTHNGTVLPLMVRGRGDLIGEFAVLDGQERTATVSAIGAVVAVRIGRSRFHDYLARHPQARSQIEAGVLAKTRLSIRRRIENRSLDANAKVAGGLYDLATAYGEPVPEGVMIAVPVSQVVLGGMVDVGESAVERVLRKLREDGVVLTRYRRIVVRDMDALKDIRDGGTP